MGSAAIQASCGAVACLPPATTAASMCSRRGPETPLMSKTLSGIRDIGAGNGGAMLGRLRCTTFHSRGFFEIKQTCYSGFHRTVENSVEKRDYARERHVGLVV